MRKPSDDELDVAIEWLRCNEGEGFEGCACASVAKWLAHEMQEDYIRKEARKAGIPVARVRRELETRGYLCKSHD